jgi:hypothetical protein
MNNIKPPSRQCAYCGEQKTALTREHIFPAALDREFSKDGTGMREPYWLDRLDEKMVGGQPTVKDVCPECNNVILSKLDSYGLQLYQRNFHRIAENNETVEFDYDYNQLLRWILKLSYNSARANKADDVKHLQKHRWYILGRHKRPARLALYLTLIYRHELDAETKARAAERNIEVSEHHTPDMLRIGHFAIQEPGWNPLVSRTVIFQSYLFSVFSLGEKVPASGLVDLKKLFAKAQKSAVFIRPDGNRVRVSAGLSSSEALNTHIMMNIPYYSRKFPHLLS